MRFRKMYWLVLLPMVLGLSCASYNTFPEARSAGLDEPAALKALIDKGQTVDDGEYRIVDVRPKSKYEKGHIPTAMNLPNGNLDGDVTPPPKDKLIIVYCETGGRAQVAAKKMAEAGYTQIYNWGGFGNWTYEPEL